MKILSGKVVAEELYKKLLLDISLLPKIPKLVVVLVGEDPASQSYVNSKTKKCIDLGLRGETIKLSEKTTQEELLKIIKGLNDDKDTHGILVQLPLPNHIDKYRVMSSIHPLKDVDGLHPENMGYLMQGKPRLVACTPFGVMKILEHYNIPLESKKVAVLGRSDIVGKPVAQLCLLKNATVTLCHSKTKNIKQETKAADIVIVAIGKPQWVDEQFVHPESVVIDVGIHKINGQIVGDVNFLSVQNKVSAITPVPGGVGPMTIACLMNNLVEAFKLQSF
jgi:methylenetetrahydrofolate dehydrogenase (NADP+)/methenyltetrahydrofolate cyclohydrolase